MLVTVPEKQARAEKLYGHRNIEIVTVRAAAAGIDVRALMRELATRGCSKVLLEGGAHLAAAALQAKMVDRIAFFIAPMIFGAGLSALEGLQTIRVGNAIRLSNLRARQVGVDWLLEAEPA